MVKSEKGIFNDKNLEIEAATNSNAREKLRNAVRVTVLNQVERISTLHNIEKGKEEELIKVGMSVFDEVFNIYVKNRKPFDDQSNFSPYFAWWARQAIVKHLDS